MELEKIDAEGINYIYAISSVKKEFKKAVNESWSDNPPWKRYQEKLMRDLAILDVEKEEAVKLQNFEKLADVDRLYSIRHSETPQNVRVLYTIEKDIVILLTAFLEKNSGDYKKAISRAQRRLKWLDN